MHRLSMKLRAGFIDHSNISVTCACSLIAADSLRQVFAMPDRLGESCKLKPLPVAKGDTIPDIKIIDPHSLPSSVKPCLCTSLKRSFLDRDADGTLQLQQFRTLPANLLSMQFRL